MGGDRPLLDRERAADRQDRAAAARAAADREQAAIERAQRHPDDPDLR